VYQALNRAMARLPVFQKDEDRKRVNRVPTETELEAARRSLVLGQPYGSETWQQRTAKAMHLVHTFRKQGRPKKPAARGGWETVRVLFFF
jgi:hypothetical protein